MDRPAPHAAPEEAGKNAGLATISTRIRARPMFELAREAASRSEHAGGAGGGKSLPMQETAAH